LDKSIISLRKFKEYSPDENAHSLTNDALIMDGKTLLNLEIFENSVDRGVDGTLMQFMGQYCVTPFGRRMFRRWLCRPLRFPSSINDRLDAVEDLIANSEWTDALGAMLKGLPDLERMIARIHSGVC